MELEDLKEKLINVVKKQVKHLMEESVTKKGIPEDSASVLSLCASVDLCLSHGLKRRAIGLFRTNTTTALLYKIAKQPGPCSELVQFIDDTFREYSISNSLSRKMFNFTRPTPSKGKQPTWPSTEYALQNDTLLPKNKQAFSNTTMMMSKNRSLENTLIGSQNVSTVNASYPCNINTNKSAEIVNINETTPQKAPKSSSLFSFGSSSGYSSNSQQSASLASGNMPLSSTESSPPVFSHNRSGHIIRMSAINQSPLIVSTTAAQNRYTWIIIALITHRLTNVIEEIMNYGPEYYDKNALMNDAVRAPVFLSLLIGPTLAITYTPSTFNKSSSMSSKSDKYPTVQSCNNFNVYNNNNMQSTSLSLLRNYDTGKNSNTPNKMLIKQKLAQEISADYASYSAGELPAYELLKRSQARAANYMQSQESCKNVFSMTRHMAKPQRAHLHHGFSSSSLQLLRENSGEVSMILTNENGATRQNDAYTNTNNNSNNVTKSLDDDEIMGLNNYDKTSIDQKRINETNLKQEKDHQTSNAQIMVPIETSQNINVNTPSNLPLNGGPIVHSAYPYQAIYAPPYNAYGFFPPVHQYNPAETSLNSSQQTGQTIKRKELSTNSLNNNLSFTLPLTPNLTPTPVNLILDKLPLTADSQIVSHHDGHDDPYIKMIERWDRLGYTIVEESQIYGKNNVCIQDYCDLETSSYNDINNNQKAIVPGYLSMHKLIMLRHDKYNTDNNQLLNSASFDETKRVKLLLRWTPNQTLLKQHDVSFDSSILPKLQDITNNQMPHQNNHSNNNPFIDKWSENTSNNMSLLNPITTTEQNLNIGYTNKPLDCCVDNPHDTKSSSSNDKKDDVNALEYKINDNDVFSNIEALQQPWNPVLNIQTPQPLCVDLSKIVYIHCHQRSDMNDILILIKHDGVQIPPLVFPKGNHLLTFLACLENALAPEHKLDPPLWDHHIKGKIFPLLKQNSGGCDNITGTPTNKTFCSTNPDKEENSFLGRLIKHNSSSRIQKYLASSKISSSQESPKTTQSQNIKLKNHPRSLDSMINEEWIDEQTAAPYKNYAIDMQQRLLQPNNTYIKNKITVEGNDTTIHNAANDNDMDYIFSIVPLMVKSKTGTKINDTTSSFLTKPTMAIGSNFVLSALGMSSASKGDEKQILEPYPTPPHTTTSTLDNGSYATTKDRNNNFLYFKDTSVKNGKTFIQSNNVDTVLPKQNYNSSFSTEHFLKHKRFETPSYPQSNKSEPKTEGSPARKMTHPLFRQEEIRQASQSITQKSTDLSIDHNLQHEYNDDIAIARESMDHLCKTMRHQIIKRVFIGWRSYCNHIAKLRKNLSQLLLPWSVRTKYLNEINIQLISGGLTRILLDTHIYDAEKRIQNPQLLIGAIYVAGIKDDLRKEIWPFLLDFYDFNSTEHERLHLLEKSHKTYFEMYSEWSQLEDLIRSRDNQIAALQLKRLAKKGINAKINGSLSATTNHTEINVNNKNTNDICSNHMENEKNNGKSSTNYVSGAYNKKSSQSSTRSSLLNFFSLTTNFGNGTNTSNANELKANGLANKNILRNENHNWRPTGKSNQMSSSNLASCESFDLDLSIHSNDEPTTTKTFFPPVQYESTSVMRDRAFTNPVASSLNSPSKNTVDDVDSCKKSSVELPSPPLACPTFFLRRISNTSLFGRKSSLKLYRGARENENMQSAQNKLQPDSGNMATRLTEETTTDQNMAKNSVFLSSNESESPTYNKVHVFPYKSRKSVDLPIDENDFTCGDIDENHHRLPSRCSTKATSSQTSSLSEDPRCDYNHSNYRLIKSSHPKSSSTRMSSTSLSSKTSNGQDVPSSESISIVNGTFVERPKSEQGHHNVGFSNQLSHNSDRSYSIYSTTSTTSNLSVEETPLTPPSNNKNVDTNCLDGPIDDLDVNEIQDIFERKCSTTFGPAKSYSKEVIESFALNIHRIDKDVLRCDRNYWFFESPHNLEKLRNVVCSYVWKNLDMGYFQGMCDLAAPLLVILEDEVVAYHCFTHIMKRLAGNFPTMGKNMDQNFEDMASLVKILDPEIYNLIQTSGEFTHFYFCYRWFLLDFKREMTYPQIFYVWETLWCAFQVVSERFVLFLALAFLEYYRGILLENSMEFTDIIKFYNEMAEKHPVNEIVSLAKYLIESLQQLLSN